jgi:hypothetical protein
MCSWYSIPKDQVNQLEIAREYKESYEEFEKKAKAWTKQYAIDRSKRFSLTKYVTLCTEVEISLDHIN